MSAVTKTPLPKLSGPWMRSRPTLLIVFTVITVILTVIGLLMALFYAGQDITQGEVQRIFYLHVSAFAGASMALGVSVIASVLYLWKRDPKWDRLSISCVEVGFALALMNLITGMVWARPIWNTWWTWDPRLTSSAIMILTYAAYFMLRAGIENPETRRRLTSVYAILAYITVIVTFVIIRIRPDTIHPAVIGPSPQNAEGGFELSSSMLAAMSFNMVVWSVFIPWVLIWWRLRIEVLSEYVNVLRAKVAEQ